jgi:integrase
MLATKEQTNHLVLGEVWKAAGQAADQAAARNVFGDYLSRKANETRRRQSADLALFADFLQTVGLPVGNLMDDPEAWAGVTWGMVESFCRWQLKRGYAVSTVNLRLSTVKTFAQLAMKAGAVSVEQNAMIRTVKGYQFKEVKRIDEQREEAGLPTRKGTKKAEATHIPTAAARKLKERPDTPKGRRDALMMCLLLDHGLRVGECAILTRDSFNLEDGTLTFERPKVSRVQTHRLTSATLAATRAYLDQDAPREGCIWRGSRKGCGGLQSQGWSKRGMTARVKTLGAALGIEPLSAHDCRHFWATRAVINGTQLDRLQDAGGWASLAMPLRYVEHAAIANEGVQLDNE